MKLTTQWDFPRAQADISVLRKNYVMHMNAQTLNATAPGEIRPQDYSLVGKDSELVIEKGLADADWCASSVPKDKLRNLLTRKDRPDIISFDHGHRGLIHEVVLEQYLKSHTNVRAVEFYPCGPPQMIACRKMLAGLGVAESQITFDKF
jgi:hypothetical protein